MSTLSIYVGESQISVLNFNSQSNFKFVSYPYVFPSELIRDRFNEDKFYSQVLKFLSKKNKLDISADRILVGTLSGAGVKIKNAQHFCISDALRSIENYVWTLVEGFTVVSKDSQASFYPLEKDLTFSQPLFTNYLSNKSLYPQIIPTSPDSFKAEDVFTKRLVANMEVTEVSGQSLIFTGGRFTSFLQNPGSAYLLALDLIRSPGIFNVKIDVANKLPVISLLNYQLLSEEGEKSKNDSKESINFLSGDLLTVNNEAVFDDEFVSVGSVLNAPGGVKCLFEIEAGNSQFVELKSDRLFVFPLDKGVTARVVVDGKSVGHSETTVKGGAIGFIIDTRDKNADDFLNNSSTRNSTWVKVINERIAAF